jgi:hypothetical protein
MESEDSSLKIGGRIKVDGFYDVDSRQPGSTFGLDDANLPLRGTTPRDLNAYKKGNFNYDLTGSQVLLDAQKKFFGHTVQGYLELDFNGNVSTTSSSFRPRIRYGYIKGCGWLVGQTGYTFADGDAFIFTFDNIYGPSRQLTVQYTVNFNQEWSLLIGADRPNTQLFQFAVRSATGDLVFDKTGFFDNDPGVSSAKSQFPDGALFLKYKGRIGYVALRGLLRDLQVRTKAGANEALRSYKKSKLGWGVGLSTKVAVVDPLTLYLQGNFGRGIGRYIDDLANERGFDSVFIYPTTVGAETVFKNSFKVVEAWNVVGGFEWRLANKVSTNIAYSLTRISKPKGLDSLMAVNFQRKLERYVGNIVYDLLPNTKMGLEVLSYRRQSGTPFKYHGRDTRILGSIIYNI